MCCKLPVIEALNKPRNTWCAHAAVGTGCKIYDARPQQCQAFVCEWLVNPQLGDAWKPDRAKFLVARDGPQYKVLVDTSAPNAWRAPQYYATLKRVAVELLAMDQVMVVIIGDRRIVVLPDRDEDLGSIGNCDIRIARRQGAGRVDYLVEAVPAVSK
jgi:hypothetical protein